MIKQLLYDFKYYFLYHFTKISRNFEDCCGGEDSTIFMRNLGFKDTAWKAMWK